MGDPRGHFQSSENWTRLENGPLTLKFDGEWTPVKIYQNSEKTHHDHPSLTLTWFLMDLGLETVHHLLAPDSQNSWVGV